MLKMTFVIVSTVLTMNAVPAFAAPAEDFVANLEGKWRGGGSVRVDRKGKRVKMRCSLSTVLNKSKRTLSMRGRCASSQGKQPLRGTIRYSADGRSIISANLRVGGRGSAASAVYRGKSIVFSGSVKADDGKTIPIRSTIRGGGKRFSLSLSANLGNGFGSVGSMRFSR